MVKINHFYYNFIKKKKLKKIRPKLREIGYFGFLFIIKCDISNNQTNFIYDYYCKIVLQQIIKLTNQKSLSNGIK